MSSEILAFPEICSGISAPDTCVDRCVLLQTDPDTRVESPRHEKRAVMEATESGSLHRSPTNSLAGLN